jgi:membrane protein YdbS with pleckstrin-like domain
MREQPLNQIDKRALAVWKLSGGITSALSWIFVIGLLILTIRFDWPVFIVIVLAILALIETTLLVLILPYRKWRSWRYEIREGEIDLQHGIIIKKRTIIPMVRIQHVDTIQGPIMRKYGLSHVIFSTAAGDHQIPALANERADRVRDQIAELARLSHDDI